MTKLDMANRQGSPGSPNPNVIVLPTTAATTYAELMAAADEAEAAEPSGHWVRVEAWLGATDPVTHHFYHPVVDGRVNPPVEAWRWEPTP